MPKPKVLVIRTAGTNCDVETAYAFECCGAVSTRLHINRLIEKPAVLKDFQILAIPGGFSYGDDIASGKLLANEIRFNLKGPIARFIRQGKLIIGICNGFQVLVKSGLLPNIDGAFASLETSLILNDSAKFEDRWVYLKHDTSRCVWTRGIHDVIYLPVAHAEGKFIAGNSGILRTLAENGQIALRYCTAAGERGGYPWNPNGSTDDIAGICDTTGRVFGLMPHPERHIAGTHHPFWTRLSSPKEPDGLRIFRNGVDFVKRI